MTLGSGLSASASQAGFRQSLLHRPLTLYKQYKSVPLWGNVPPAVQRGRYKELQQVPQSLTQNLSHE